ncbi:hypothetical protein [Flavobacterium psychrotrophum]|uniref:hypothetical protein n=1 Tax=Flavobacterium psychrotrophum TaxID=2294119 RepID=UPI000E316E02|nr:hypothetical protein [Flavobacterium psychrotrophum]
MKNLFRHIIIASFLAVCISGNAQEGANDPTFNPIDTSLGNGTNDAISDMEVQPDGKILLAGNFSFYKNIESHHIVRLNADRSIDISFNVGALIDGYIDEIVVQNDGKILISGGFTHYGNNEVNGFARLNANGSLDTTFNTGPGFNNKVYKLLIQPDNKILVAGSFSSYNGVACYAVIRLNYDGSIDNSFAMNSSITSVLDIVFQDDKIIIAGRGSANSYTVKRFLSTGAEDTTFYSWYGNIGFRRSLEIQQDNKILVASWPVSFEESPSIVRLNANGRVDSSFSGGLSSDATITDIVLQEDNKIIIVGEFTNYGSAVAHSAARLNTNGQLDATFNTPLQKVDYPILVAATRSDGLLFGGMFTMYNSICSNYLIALDNNGNQDTIGYDNDKGANNEVSVIVDAGGGNMLLGGNFTHYNGVAKNKLTIINADGGLVESFNPGAGPDGWVNQILRQTDGRYIIVGDFNSYNGIPRKNIARINADGSLDESYNALTAFYPGSTNFGILQGARLQSDDKLIIYGVLYDQVIQPGQFRFAIRINIDGTLDETFTMVAPNQVVTGGIPLVEDLHVLSDGKIIFSLQQYSSSGRAIFRVNTDGSLDNSFPLIEAGFNNYNHKLLPDANGGFIISSQMSSGTNTPNIIQYRKMTADGILETNPFYSTGEESGEILFFQADGKFFVYKGMYLENQIIKRFNSDGTADHTFNSGDGFRGFHKRINTAFFQQDKIIIAGSFERYDGAHRSRIVRITSTGTLNADKPEIKASKVIIYKNNEGVIVKSMQQPIVSVQVYDLAGKLLASDATTIGKSEISLQTGNTKPAILIVKATLADGKVINKKIY